MRLYQYIIYFSLLFTAVTVSFQESANSIVEGSSDQLCGQLSSETGIPVIVTLSINGGTAQLNTDFTISSLALAFQPGSVLSCTTFSVTNDPTLEVDETVILSLQSVNSNVLISSTAGTTIVTIPNQDSKLTLSMYISRFLTACGLKCTEINRVQIKCCMFLFNHAVITVSFQETFSSIEEGSSAPLCGQLSLEAEIQVMLTLSINGGNAQPSTDFTLSNLAFTFESGSTIDCINISIVDDSTLEEDEIFTLILESDNSAVLVSSTAGVAMVTIPNQNCKKVYHL